MDYYNFQNRNFSSGPHLLGAIMIFAGLFVLTTPYFLVITTQVSRVYWLSGGTLSIGLMITSSYKGALINFKNRKFKEYTAFLGCKFGKWNSLPQLAGLKLTVKESMSTNVANGISPTWSGKAKFYNLVLLDNDRKPEFTFTFTSKKKAEKHGQILVSGLYLAIIKD
ncbi:MAG: hypothetical protein AAGA64_15925 [Bacteroidota bacterium]